jgi:hypothetical protein
MSCWRIDVRRNLARYLDGAAPPALTDRVERHLMGCGDCRATVVRLRSARAAVRTLPLVTPSSSEGPVWAGGAQRRPRWFPHFLADAAVAAGFAVAFTLLATHVVAARADWSSFRALRLADLRTSTDPHVVTEGTIVSREGESDEKGSRRFRLRDGSADVVCEVLEDARVSVPAIGQRVRVYGVSRYDARADHQWYEIHPVLRIETIR